MKRKIIVVIFVFLLMTAFNTSSEASTVYNFDVTVDYTGIGSDFGKIQGIEFKLSGTQGIDWVFGSFMAPYNGTWYFSSTGIIDDKYESGNISTSVPLNNGRVEGSSIAVPP